MKNILIMIFCVMVALGCARVSVQAPKEPIKVDISMRVDVYQHIQNDIDAIEDMVSGSSEEEIGEPVSKNSLMDYFICNAYAGEDLGAGVKKAALRRKNRHEQLISLMEEGIIGENRSGLVEIRDASASGSKIEKMIGEENQDRMVIYQALAEKNNTPIEEIQSLYAGRLQNDAPKGTPVEVLDKKMGAYDWKMK